jgi:hypothetical protein
VERFHAIHEAFRPGRDDRLDHGDEGLHPVETRVPRTAVGVERR